MVGELSPVKQLSLNYVCKIGLTYVRNPYHRAAPPNPTLQRQNTKILKQIFPEKGYRDLSPNFHNHASVSDLFIPMIGLPILLEEICIPILCLYKSLIDT
jgi:hypothetical protein